MAQAPTAYTEPRAHALRERYCMLYGGDEIPVPIESVAEDLLGLHVTETELNGVSGLLIPAERHIYVIASDSPARRRFTVAHELGHWICQCLGESTAPVYCRHADVGGITDRAVEREANVFAAELLMPERFVRQVWDETYDIARSAARCGVSTEAMHWRLFSFGLVGERPR